MTKEDSGICDTVHVEQSVRRIIAGDFECWWEGNAVPTLDDLLRKKDLRTTEHTLAGEAAELILGVLSEVPLDSKDNYLSAAAILDTCHARSTGELRTVFENWTPALMMLCIELIKDAAEEIAGQKDQSEPTDNEQTPQVSPQSPLAKAFLRRKR